MMKLLDMSGPEARAYTPHTELRVGFFDDENLDGNRLVIK